jgi:ligand-binding sensor domain-containing protein
LKTTYPIIAIIVFSLLFRSCKDNGDSANGRGPVWVTFTNVNTPGLMGNTINCIMKDGEGAIWFGTDSGAAKYSSGRWTTIRDLLSWTVYNPTRTLCEVKSMAEGRGGIIWFGLAGGGLRAYNRNKISASFKTWQTFDTLGSVIDAVAALKNINGDVFASVNFKGVYRYVPPTVDTEDPLSGYFVQESIDKFGSKIVRCITADLFNEWIFFGAPAGIAYVNTRTSPWSWSFHEIISKYSSPAVSIAVDFSNTIWAGKWYGVTQYNPGSGIEKNYIPDNTGYILPDSWINATATNLYDIRWFGTSAGLVQYADTTWTIFNQSNTPELPSDNILSLYYDPIRKNLWIGTDKGIAVYNKEGTNI